VYCFATTSVLGEKMRISPLDRTPNLENMPLHPSAAKTEKGAHFPDPEPCVPLPQKDRFYCIGTDKALHPVVNKLNKMSTSYITNLPNTESVRGAPTENSSVPERYANLAYELAGKGDFKGAEEMYKKVVQLLIEIPGAGKNRLLAAMYFNLANLSMNKRDLKGSQQMYEKVPPLLVDYYKTDCHPDVWSLYELLGDVMLAQNEVASAEAYYEKVLKIMLNVYETESNSDVIRIYQKLGQVFRMQCKLQKEAELLEKARRIDISLRLKAVFPE
jgi:tetratricopeptide (TPR) repeat protein